MCKPALHGREAVRYHKLGSGGENIKLQEMTEWCID